jgi:UDP-glucose-4-epimerase GalE
MLLVTGGAGYIGSHAVRALRTAGHSVVAYDDLSEGHRDALLGAPLVEGDILDTELLVRTLAHHEVRGVLHFAARCYVGESMEKPELYWRINRDGTRSLLAAMRRTGVGALVFSSTCAVYGEPGRLPMDEDLPQRPLNVYGETKAAMEREIRAADGLRHVIFRYFNAAGASEDGVLSERHDPESHLIPLALAAARDGAELVINGDDYATPDGTCVRDYVHVCDLAEAHLAALRRLEEGGPSGRFNLGSGNGMTVKQVLDAVGRVAGSAVPYSLGPRRPGDPARLVASSGLAQRELGWRPRLGELQAIVRTAWTWHTSHPDGYGRRSRRDV